ncbi:unnamed protein product [Sphagnum tenellum]
MVILLNAATPQTRKESVVEQLATQAQGLAIFIFIYGAVWAFGVPAWMRYPDKEMQDFYPIFAVLNSTSGAFLFCFLGLSSGKFRDAMFGQARKKRDQLMALQFTVMSGLIQDDENEDDQTKKTKP